MSFKMGFFAARGVTRERLTQLLHQAAAHPPSDAAVERFLVSEEGDWTAALVMDGFGWVHRWAQAVSAEGQVACVSIFVLEDTWNYEIFDKGEHVLGMEFFSHERPLLRGDAGRAAQLLGCPVEVFARYHEAIMAACEDPDGDYPMAYDDDEFEAADEYGYLDFARRIGVPGDPAFDDEPISVRLAGRLEA